MKGDGFKHKHRKKLTAWDIGIIKDRIIEVFYVIAILLAILLMIFLVVTEIYVVYRYGDMPISEVPSWAYWFMQD